MPGSILGNEVRRVEDPDLLLGRGTFIENLRVEGMLHAVFVRSTVAHARLRSVDVEEARRQPGVVDVLVAADLGLPDVAGLMKLHDDCLRPPLARDKVSFVGDCIALVLADSVAAAVDAAEHVVVDYDDLEPAVDMEAALAPGAPVQIEALGSNLAGTAHGGNDTQAGGGGVGDPLAGAEVVVRGRFENQRVAVVPLEGNAVAAIPSNANDGDSDGHELTVYAGTQMPHLFLRMASSLLGVPRERIRVIAPHVGGAFGAKTFSPEHLVVLAAARKVGRPVVWVENRSENMVGMPHGRGQVQYIELGLTREGVITGMRGRVVGDAGAYGGFGGVLPMGPTRTMAQGVYRIPKIAFDVAVAVTNTTPMGAFRGAGRPEATAFLERIIDIAADELGIDPVVIRHRNLLQPEDFPYTTLMGATYDTGDYGRALDEAVRIAGYDDLRAEQQRRREAGDVRQMGIGVSTYVEVTAGGGGKEFASVEVHDDGTVTVMAGTSAHGQGHATSFAMIVADRLGIAMEQIRYVQSDTALVARGGGTGGSRSLQMGGNAVGKAAEAVLERAREIAGRLLEAAPEDIVVAEAGGLGVAGVPAVTVAWDELARAATDEGEPLLSALDFEQAGATFPFGAHVAVVEVDTETGHTTLVRHIAVDDCGRVLNPLIVRGQQHGGIAQGVAQALWEAMVYDDAGNPITSTLADYGMPTAAEFPSFEAVNIETPTHLNPLGAKGIGESGTIGAMPAVQNAVVDAVSHLGVRHVDMPCTPERVWRAIESARAGGDQSCWREPLPVFASAPGGVEDRTGGVNL